ncbi:biotin synthase BioB [Paraeggerthella sp.]|uniref:biotin synthase BioB n=1 Tax=Paraeggerthella sp. TaxID=2897350 RepID=UPI003AB44C91
MSAFDRNPIARCERIAVEGGDLSRDDLMALAAEPLTDLAAAANRIRQARCGDDFDLCSIVNAKSGRCPENCAYCAQSAHWNASVQEYPFQSVDAIVDQAKRDVEAGVQRFSLVASGQKLSPHEIEQAASAIAAVKRATGVSVCASLGLLSQEDFAMLAQAGLERVHNNLETSRAFFPHICTSHGYDDKLHAIQAARDAGLEVCSGGIIGLGESRADRIDLALELRAIGPDSVPINVLNPIPGTPLANMPPLGHDEVLRTVALFRFAMPGTSLRLAGGRALLSEAGRDCLSAGANALISGDMLTTGGFTVLSDRAMAASAGFFVPAPII